jgi:hypothetical protein
MKLRWSPPDDERVIELRTGPCGSPTAPHEVRHPGDRRCVECGEPLTAIRAEPKEEEGATP